MENVHSMDEKQFLKCVIEELDCIKSGMYLCEYDEVYLEIEQLIEKIKQRKINLFVC